MRVLLLALALTCLAACSNHNGDVEKRKQLTVETGQKFAGDLVAGKFTDAHALLAADLKKEYSPRDLSQRYGKMIASWHGQRARLDGHFAFMDDWPARRVKDLGWVYISISSEDNVEAVTVIVTDENGRPRIREIEWGRP